MEEIEGANKRRSEVRLRNTERENMAMDFFPVKDELREKLESWWFGLLERLPISRKSDAALVAASPSV
jgi:hypothetical protein